MFCCLLWDSKQKVNYTGAILVGTTWSKASLELDDYKLFKFIQLVWNVVFFLYGIFLTWKTNYFKSLMI